MTTTQTATRREIRRAPRSLREAWIALAGLSAVFLFEMLDNSVLDVALPSIGRDLHATTSSLQWVSGAYSLVFGGTMLLFGAIADRFGRRRVMLTGLVLLAVASLATALVTTTEELIAVRALVGLAAGMTTPGSMALAFRLFATDDLRVRALTVISTAGLVGLALGPTAGGLVLSVAPWQVLLLANVPIAVLALVGIRLGVGIDDPNDLHTDPIDVAGAVLGTATIVAALLTPTLLVADGTGSPVPWAAAAATVLAATAFVLHERSAPHPLLDLTLIARPLVASGLAYKAAAGLAVAGSGYLVTLQLQFAWGWSPTAAALGMLPQVVVLLAGGRFVGPFVARVGLERAAWLSATAVVAGLAVFALASRHGYPWIVLALVLVAAGMRVVGVVAGTNVLRGLPADRTSVGAALVDTSSELATAIGIAATGTILAALFTGSLTAPHWSPTQAGQFQQALEIAGLTLAVAAAALVALGVHRSRRGTSAAASTPTPIPTPTHPPFDPELAVFLTAMQARGPFTLTTEALPRMRALDVTEEELDETLRAKGLERRSVTVPGHLGDPIDLAIIQRIGRTSSTGATGPAAPAACFYAIHGGGMVMGHHLGNLDSYDDWLLTHDVVLISVDYRLAPEHPDPYPVEDCYAGLVWTAEHAEELGIDPDRIVLVGQSAGGGLAAGTVLLARDRQGPTVLAQVLVSPMLDDSDSTVSTHQIDGVGIADRAMTRFGWNAYLENRRGSDDVSIYAAPARASDLSGLPPAYLDCGSTEVFRDETVAYAGRLWAAGVQAELHVWPGAFHGFTSMQPHAALSRTAVAALATWTTRLLDH